MKDWKTTLAGVVFLLASLVEANAAQFADYPEIVSVARLLGVAAVAGGFKVARDAAPPR